MVLNEGVASIRKSDECCMSEDISKHLQTIIDRYYETERHLFDYEQCRNSEEYYRAVLFTRQLKDFDPVLKLTTDAKRLAFWMNVYNLLLIHAACFSGVEGSLKENSGFYRDHSYEIGGYQLNLDEIEHGVLRRNARLPGTISKAFSNSDSRRVLVLSKLDPRLHTGLYSACFSSPPLKTFNSSTAEECIGKAAQGYLQKFVSIGDRKLNLPMIFKWYAKDFGDSGVRHFIINHHPDRKLVQELLQNSAIKENYISYDWHLNAA
ncbi:hypothetical protein EOPP23_00850 [Endozoicomonas sp. OPT23]|uniref:DUF547 domain-containing protein n=1 Tax=Endozoicomonas sp. OPT23 TaxID=2072845 RepID=UPI00129BAC3B|nr:DUF547 domain-containing protein [Endozoicomonas sp. OPT23]MRI31539.1 hypothetical protein [Endozoicomonas sp. OPT23]